jgi:hypothetical protein
VSLVTGQRSSGGYSTGTSIPVNSPWPFSFGSAVTLLLAEKASNSFYLRVPFVTEAFLTFGGFFTLFYLSLDVYLYLGE